MSHVPDSPSIATLSAQSFEKPLSHTITEAIIGRTDLKREELPPLYEVIDPDALENLFRNRLNGASRTKGRVAFQYAGCNVTVYSDRMITVDPSPDN